MNRKIGVVYSYVLMFVEVISAMLFTPFLIRMLGQSQYAVYQFTSQISSYLTLLDLGVGNAVIRYMAKYRADNNKEKQEEFLGIATVFYLVVAVITVIIGIVLVIILPTAFAKGLTPEEIRLSQKMLCVTMLTCAVTLGTSSFATTLIAYECFSFSKGLTIICNIFKVGISIAALALGVKAFGIVTINLVINLITRLTYTFYVLFKLKIRPRFKNPDISFIKETVTYSSFVFLQMLATQINSMTDTVLLGILAKGSSAIIAVYSVGSQIIQYFKTIGSHVNGVLMAGVVRMVENGAKPKALQNEMVRIGRIIFMILGMVFAVFIANGRHFMVLWAGEDYAQSYYVAVAIMVPTMFTLIQNIGNQILWAMNRHKGQAIVQVVAALVNIVLTAILISWKPLEGAVIGSVIALTVGDVVWMNIIFKKKIGISLTEYYMGLFKGILPSLLICFVGAKLFTLVGLSQYGWLGFVVNCAVAVAVYGVCMITFGMNKSEKDLVFGMFRKILRKTKLVKG